ncbi:MAG: cysteine hydrolase, partial [Anaerolineae bacterium]
MENKKRKLIEGQPVLVVIDIQGGGSSDDEGESSSDMPFMSDYQDYMDRAPALVEKARECDIPIVFFQEAHRRN